MAQPTGYNKSNEFAEYAEGHTADPLDHTALDEEFDNIETSLDSAISAINDVRRDDGAVKNAVIHPDSFTTASLALIAATWTPRSLWLTATAYVVGDVVQNSTTSYVCATAHTSGTFATDYSAGKWTILGETKGQAASAVTATAYGHIAATNVQAFLEELVDEKARLAGSTSQTFDVSDATDDTHAVAAGQIQKSSLVHAAAAGSADALTATIASGLTTLSDGMHVRIEAAAANATTAPTLNLTLGSTATGAKTVKKGAAGALVAGDIIGAGHKLELVYDSSADAWLLQNPAYAVGTSTAEFEAGEVKNCGLSFSVGSSALTATVTAADGTTPTAANPVQVSMRSATAATGTLATRSVTATLSLTISSGSTLGHTSAVAGTIHWYLIDNAGTLELAASTNFFGYSGIVSTTAEGGAGAADSALVMYSTSARSNVAFQWVGLTVDTQTTAGTWAATPTKVSLVRDNDMHRSATASGLNITARTNSGTPNSQIDITFEELVVKDSSGNKLMLTSGSFTVDIAAEGALGFDNLTADAEDASTWYYGWVLAKSDGTKTAVLSKATALASVVVSHASLSGYTFGALVTAVRNNGSSNFIAYRQNGFLISWTAVQVLVSSGSATTETSITLSAAVPPIATEIGVEVYGSAATAGSSTYSCDLYIIASGSRIAQIYVTGVDNPGTIADANTCRLLHTGYLAYKNVLAGSASTPSVNIGIIDFRLPGGGQ